MPWWRNCPYALRNRSVYWTPLRDSTHIWAAPLPRGLAPGVRRTTIRAIDEYGQEHGGRNVDRGRALIPGGQ